MRLEFDTRDDNLETIMNVVKAAYGVPQSSGLATSESTESAGDSILPGNWTEKRLRKWAHYMTDGAQEVVRYVAANAPEVPFADVAAHLGRYQGGDGPVSGKTLGGVMSSGGHALKQVGQMVKSQPFDRDWARDVYVIDSRIAEILADELGGPADV